MVDLKSIAGLRDIAPQPDGSLRIGPLATLAEVAAHAGVRSTHRALAQACGEAASPQIRNVATIGGNLLQRPRCWYYRLESYKCLKKGGDVCYAVGGENRYHVIFGGGPSYATHPSNAAVPLVAFGASFVLEGAKGPRTRARARLLHARPRRTRSARTSSQPDEVLTEIRVPAAAGWRSAYDDVRERAAFDWPLVSVAAARARSRAASSRKRGSCSARWRRSPGGRPGGAGAGGQGARRDRGGGGGARPPWARRRSPTTATRWAWSRPWCAARCWVSRHERRGEHGRPQGRARLPPPAHEDVLRDGPRPRGPARGLADRRSTGARARPPCSVPTTSTAAPQVCQPHRACFETE